MQYNNITRPSPLKLHSNVASYWNKYVDMDRNTVHDEHAMNGACRGSCWNCPEAPSLLRGDDNDRDGKVPNLDIGANLIHHTLSDNINKHLAANKVATGAVFFPE